MSCQAGQVGRRPERILVAVSVPPQAYFVERIGGDRVQVAVMIPPGYSHVDYPLTPHQMVALSRARLYVAVGHPSFEFEASRLLPFLSTLPDLQVVDMSAGLEGLPGWDDGEHAEGEDPDGHPGGDPHTWVAPVTVRVAARNIAVALERLDPPHAAEYRKNLAAFERDIDALDSEIRSRLAGVRGARFMVYHPTWGYFAREYGIQQVAIESEGKEPSAARLIQLIGLARRHGVRAIFVQAGFPRKSAQVIADAVGGRVAVADPQERDWLHNLRRVARSFQVALAPGGSGSVSGGIGSVCGRCLRNSPAAQTYSAPSSTDHDATRTKLSRYPHG
jgi:zinc transport system substrate-binding protein